MENKSSHKGGLWIEQKEGNGRLKIIVRSNPRVQGERERTKGRESCG